MIVRLASSFSPNQNLCIFCAWWGLGSWSGASSAGSDTYRPLVFVNELINKFNSILTSSLYSQYFLKFIMASQAELELKLAQVNEKLKIVCESYLKLKQ